MTIHRDPIYLNIVTFVKDNFTIYLLIQDFYCCTVPVSLLALDLILESALPSPLFRLH